MTVQELIECLKQYDPTMDVRICRQDWHDPIEDKDIFVVETAQGAEFPHLLIS